MLANSLVSLERRCVHFYPAPTSGRPTERGAAFREVEPHAERQVHNIMFSVQGCFFLFVFFKDNTQKNISRLTVFPVAHICLLKCTDLNHPSNSLHQSSSQSFSQLTRQRSDCLFKYTCGLECRHYSSLVLISRSFAP